MSDQPQSLRFSPEAEWAFAGHVAAVEAGRESDFEALCGRHPELAEELRGLKAQWEQVAGVVQRLLHEPSSTGAAPDGSRLVEPGPGLGDSGGNDLVQQLAEHSPPSSRYELRGEFARGGMGVILKVWDKDLRRDLAMKVVLGKEDSALPGSTLAVDAPTLGRFLDEAQVTGQLDHPGVVPVHELGIDARGRIYFTMRLVKGRHLGEVLGLMREGRESWTRTRALGVLLRVCEAMAYAHSKGVVHRDLKPSNVMVGRFGEVYVMDWGLARVSGRKDPHDLRLPTSVVTHALRTERSERAETPDSPIVTMDGTVVGTPSYMPPEQAEGRVEELGPRSDVYSVGAILYELLTGQRPYVRPGSRPSPHTILALLLQGPPTSIEKLTRDVPAELVAICERAMARDPAQRYPDMSALAEDLSAYLEHRVVTAYRTGAVAELRKWVERNTGLAGALAAALVLLVGGLVTGLLLHQRGQEAERRRAEVLRLSALQNIDDLRDQAGALWPARPENIVAYREWLDEARALTADLPLHRATLAELRTRAVPRTKEQRLAERQSHPDHAQLVQVEGELAFRSRALAQRRAGQAARLPELDEAALPAAASDLNNRAWPRVNPDRKDFGEEPLGLVLALRAVELAQGEVLTEARDTLAWAYFALGRDDEALATMIDVLRDAPDARRKEFESSHARLQAAVATAASSEGWSAAELAIAALEEKRAELDARVEERRDWFPVEELEDRWWNNQLTKLIAGLEELESGLLSEAGDAVTEAHGWSVPRRLAFAERLRAGYEPGGEYARRWEEALPEMRKAYPGVELKPQMGLVPVGVDDFFGLWEFAELTTGTIPERDAEGGLVLTEESGLVFVLLPGGTFTMGAQRRDPAADNFDPDAEPDEGPTRRVTLSPFFLSKYEMTQGQWSRFSGRNPSMYNPSHFDRGWTRAGLPFDLVHPVEHVSWRDCSRLCTRLGLLLPSEAQWEFAARGHTATPWWTGEDPNDLREAANVRDAWAKGHGGPQGTVYAPWDDGALVHLLVDDQDPNPFGFHGMLGNVWEWCLDGYFDPYPSLTHDPVAPPGAIRVRRGGSFGNSELDARSANRGHDSQEAAVNECGLRPARALEGI